MSKYTTSPPHLSLPSCLPRKTNAATERNHGKSHGANSNVGLSCRYGIGGVDGVDGINSINSVDDFGFSLGRREETALLERKTYLRFPTRRLSFPNRRLSFPNRRLSFPNQAFVRALVPGTLQPDWVLLLLLATGARLRLRSTPSTADD